MRFFIKFIILLFYPFFSFGQVDKASLLKIWNNNLAEDSLRLQAINQICTPKYIYNNPDSAFYFSEKAYELAKNKGLKKEMANTLYSKGMASSYLENFKNAEEYLIENISLNKEIEDTLGLAKTLNCLGNVFLKQSNYVKAIESYRNSLSLFEKIKNQRGIAILKNNIGLIFYDLKEFNKSLEYLDSSLSIYKELGIEINEANTLINIGSVYRQQKEYKSALGFYEQGLRLKNKFNIREGVAMCQSNLGLVYQALGDLEKAMDLFSQSLELNRKEGNKKEIANCLLYIGSIHKENQRNDLTINLAKEALVLAKETGNAAELAHAAEVLYENYEANGQFKKALEMFTLAQQTKDSIYGIEVKIAVLKNEAQYLEKNKFLKEQLLIEKKLKEKKAKSRIERFAFFGILSSLLAFFIFFIQKKQKQNIVEQKNLNTKIESLKEKLATQSTILVEKRKELSLDKDKIENVINSKLGESSWVILNILFENPAISNKDIASKVSLSLEGVSSSLRRMYTAFEIKSSNKKIALIMKAIKISIEET